MSGSERQNNSVRAPVIDAIESVITTDDNNFLTAPFQPQEFKDAMFSMHPNKCPGPDGFNPGFFSTFLVYLKCFDHV